MFCTGLVRDIVRSAHDLRIKSVPETAEIDEMPRPGRIGLEFPAKCHDVVVDDPVVQGEARGPRGIDQLFAREYPSPARNEGAKELEFERAHVDDATGALHFAAPEVHQYVAELEPVRGVDRRTPKQGLDPSPQFTGTERLGEVIIGAELESHESWR